MSTTRLTHADVRRACGAHAGAKEMQCPNCGHNHLQLFGEDDFKCQNGCETGDVAAKIRLRIGNGSFAPTTTAETKPATHEAPSGKLTLAEYGIEKHLEERLLTQWFGAREGTHPYYSKIECGVCLPYFNERGEEVTQQWRWGMGGKSRRFLKGKSSYLYGGHFLELLEKMAADGQPRQEIIIAEGESNVHTLAQNGLAALGLPGVSNWQHEWAQLQCLAKAKRIYVFLDMKDGKPEDQAILGARKIAESFPAEKVWAVKLPMPFKDVSEMWLYNTTEALGGGIEGFRTDFQTAILSARPIIPEREEIEGLPTDIGVQVFDACPILKEFVDLTAPEVETDINNLVCAFLACAGTAISLKAFASHLADKHSPATYHLLIGDSAIGKGTTFGCANQLFELAVPEWRKMVRRSARSQQSLYRMLQEVSDTTIAGDEEEDAKPNPDYNGGRLLLRLSEVSAVFKSMRAEWSTMSQGLREAFDGNPLSNERGDTSLSIRVSDPYALTLLGDITKWELSEVIDAVDFANGIANRFIWWVTHRIRTIPHAKPLPDYSALAARLKLVIPTEPLGQLLFSEAGQAAWDAWVFSLPLEEEGRLGSACGRMRANALRMAVLFSVLDEARLGKAKKPCIEPSHVHAAAAIMARHRNTVAWFLENSAKLPAALPDAEKPKLYRQIERLRAALKNGRITSAEVKKLFSNKTKEERIAIAEAAGLVMYMETDEKGYKIEVWEG